MEKVCLLSRLHLSTFFNKTDKVFSRNDYSILSKKKMMLQFYQQRTFPKQSK